jgi:hypothetical protein
MFVAAVLLLSIPAWAQLTVDATGTHKAPKKTSVIRCGGIGRKLPIQVAIEVPGSPGTEKGKNVVLFVLTNSGKESLSIPVSPDPESVEPDSQNYSLERLRLYLGYCAAPSKWPCALAENQVTLSGGANLYGNQQTATVVLLAPGESVRVRGEVALPTMPTQDQNHKTVYVASATLVVETVSTTHDQTLRECTEDLGSAYSPEYGLQELLNSR